MRKLLPLLALMVVAASMQSFGAITWQTAGITGDSDVNTKGTVKYAYSLGFLPPGYVGTTVEVNGVAFQQLFSNHE